PQKIPSTRCFFGRLRQASAITTALSPDSRMLMKMISSAATQNGGEKNSIEPTSLQDFLDQLAHLGGVSRDTDAASFHHLELLLGRALAARDNGTRVAHPLARRRRDAGDESDNGLAHVFLDPKRGVLLVGSADLADHHHGDRVGIVV